MCVGLCTYQSLTAFHYNEFLLRGCSCKHHLWMAPQRVIQLITAHILQLTTAYHTSTSIPAHRQNTCTKIVLMSCSPIVRNKIPVPWHLGNEQQWHGYLLLTCSTGIRFLKAMSSTVSLPSVMIPTLAAIALAVIGWSPVTMITWCFEIWNKLWEREIKMEKPSHCMKMQTLEQTAWLKAA